ncbi:ribonuclease H-like domain-containing protein [Tanacetum coccineum]
MQKNLGSHCKYFKKIYKPTNNNLITSSNTRNKNVDTTPRYKNDNQTGQFGNQRAVNVAGDRETVGGQVVQHGNGLSMSSDSPDMCDNDIQDDQNDVECDDERVALANLIANLKLDVDENKKIQKQLKKANATLTQELTECKSILAETSRTLRESNSIRDSCLVALQNKQTEFERYKAFNDRTVDYDKLERKLNETLGLLAKKEIDIKEGLKVKAYEISVVKEKHDELVKHSLLTKSHYEGLVKEKTKVITDLKPKKEKDIDKMISMENQLKFLNEIVYKRSQSIQTIHMLAPKCPTFNGRPTFANPMYLKKAQNEIPCLYAIPHDQSDPANRLVPDREETLTLNNESRSKLNKDLVKPFDYTKLNNGSLELQCFIFIKSVECGCLAQKLSEQTEFIVQLILFIVDFGCTKHMTGNLSLLCNFVKKYLGSSCEVSKVKRSSFKSKTVPSSKGRLNLLHMDLCGPMRVATINGKKYILVIVDDYSRYTWTLFLRSKDETPEVLKDFLTMIQRNLQAPVISVRTDRGTEFLNKTLNAFFKEEGIEHQTSTPQTLK